MEGVRLSSLAVAALPRKAAANGLKAGSDVCDEAFERNFDAAMILEDSLGKPHFLANRLQSLDVL